MITPKWTRHHKTKARKAQQSVLVMQKWIVEEVFKTRDELREVENVSMKTLRRVDEIGRRSFKEWS